MWDWSDNMKLTVLGKYGPFPAAGVHVRDIWLRRKHEGTYRMRKWCIQPFTAGMPYK